jgi:hypothetical protein
MSDRKKISCIQIFRWIQVYHGLMQRLLNTSSFIKIYLSFTPVNFSNHFNGIRTKNRPVWITPGDAPLRWMGPNCNPRWEQKQTEGYVIVHVSKVTGINKNKILALSTIHVCMDCDICGWSTKPVKRPQSL